MRAIFCSALLLVLPLAGLTQASDPSKYFDRYAHPQKSNVFTAVGVGFSAYDGTITILTDTDNQNRFLNPQISFDIGYQVTNYVAVILRANYIRMNLESDRSSASVSSNNIEGVAVLRHYIFSQKEYDEYLRKFNYYGFGGIGGLYLNPKNRLTDEPYADSQEFDQFTLSVPVGLGTEYRLSNFFSMALEASYHFTGSDYLDGVSGNNIKGRSGNDRFALFNLRVGYRLPRKDYKYNELLKLKQQDSKVKKQK